MRTAKVCFPYDWGRIDPASVDLAVTNNSDAPIVVSVTSGPKGAAVTTRSKRCCNCGRFGVSHRYMDWGTWCYFCPRCACPATDKALP